MKNEPKTIKQIIDDNTPLYECESFIVPYRIIREMLAELGAFPPISPDGDEISDETDNLIYSYVTRIVEEMYRDVVEDVLFDFPMWEVDKRRRTDPADGLCHSVTLFDGRYLFAGGYRLDTDRLDMLPKKEEEAR